MTRHRRAYSEKFDAFVETILYLCYMIRHRLDLVVGQVKFGCHQQKVAWKLDQPVVRQVNVCYPALVAWPESEGWDVDHLRKERLGLA